MVKLIKKPSIKNRRCKHCLQKVGENGVLTPVGAFCDYEHAAKYAKEKSNQKRLKDYDSAVVKKQSSTKKIKKHGEYENDAEKAVRRYVRARDYFYPCISCGKAQHLDERHAGHYRSVGSANHMRFNVFNINVQCGQCNTWKASNAIKYREGMVVKYGEEKVLEIESDQTMRKYTIEDLDRMKRIFNKKARRQEKRNDWRSNK